MVRKHSNYSVINHKFADMIQGKGTLPKSSVTDILGLVLSRNADISSGSNGLESYHQG